MKPVHCEQCRAITPGYDLIHLGSTDEPSRQLCTACYNIKMAELSGLVDFDNPRFAPVDIADCAGKIHRFHFQTRLLGNLVAMEAFNLIAGDRGAHQFEMIGASKDDLFALLGRLIEKIRRRLAIRHIGDDGHGLQIIEQTVRGRIDWDDAQEGHVPLVVVDGREITWDAFGRMLMAFEGWQFKLEICDRSEEP